MRDSCRCAQRASRDSNGRYVARTAISHRNGNAETAAFGSRVAGHVGGRDVMIPGSPGRAAAAGWIILTFILRHRPTVGGCRRAGGPVRPADPCRRIPIEDGEASRPDAQRPLDRIRWMQFTAELCMPDAHGSQRRCRASESAHPTGDAARLATRVWRRSRCDARYCQGPIWQQPDSDSPSL